MLRPVIALSLVLSLGAAAPAVAKDDPLLSGYGGPGGGDQAVLGAKLLPARKGKGSLRAASGTPAPARRSTGAPAPAPAPASGGRAATPTAPGADGTTASPGATARAGDNAAGARRPSSSSTRRASSGRRGGRRVARDRRSPGPRSDGAARTERPGATSPAPAVAPVADLSRGSAGPPLSRDDVLLGLLALLAIGGIALVTARLARAPMRA